MTLGKRIRQFRLQKAISQEKLAKTFDVSLDELSGNMKKQMSQFL